MKGINSDDDKLVQESFTKADKLIGKTNDDEIEEEGIKTKTGVSRSVINKYTEADNYSRNVQPQDMSQSSDQNAFLSVLESDAKERYERRKLNTKLANELKDKGNVEFQNGNYEKAIEFYSEVSYLKTQFIKQRL